MRRAYAAWLRLLSAGTSPVEAVVRVEGVAERVEQELIRIYEPIFRDFHDIIAELQTTLDELRDSVTALIQTMPSPVPSKVAKFLTAVADACRDVMDVRIEVYAPQGGRAPSIWTSHDVDKIMSALSTKLGFLQSNVSVVTRHGQEDGEFWAGVDKVMQALTVVHAVFEEFQTLYSQLREPLLNLTEMRSAVAEAVKKVEAKQAIYRRSSSSLSSQSSVDDQDDVISPYNREEAKLANQAKAVEKAYRELNELLKSLAADIEIRLRVVR